jgi:hypothetical protein
MENYEIKFPDLFAGLYVFIYQETTCHILSTSLLLIAFWQLIVLSEFSAERLS